MDIVDKYINDILLNEAKSASRRKVSRSEKINREIGKLAVAKAKKENDSMYNRYVKYRDLYKDLKAKIIKKYGPRVRSQARK